MNAQQRQISSLESGELKDVYVRTRRPQEECAVIAVLGTPRAAELTAIGLSALQHRGEEATGIAVFNPNPGINQYSFGLTKGKGLAHEVYRDDPLIRTPGFSFAIGHNRYSTAGGSDVRNAHPLFSRIPELGELYLAHNGNLTNAAVLREALGKKGCIFQTSVDTELILHLIAQKVKEFKDADQPLVPEEIIEQALREVRGSYSLVVLMEGKFFAIRDPNGFRPLVYGRNSSGALVFASETCAIDKLGFTEEGTVLPGQLCSVVLNKEGNVGEVRSRIMSVDSIPVGERRDAFCSFEYAYFANPASRFDGRLVLQVRDQLGVEAAQQWRDKLNLENAIVIPVPDSGRFSGEGFAYELGLRPTAGILRNQFVGRSFISPDEETRRAVAKNKRTVVPSLIDGKDVVLVDDSLVRGNTIRGIVQDVYKAGARSVTLVITTPPIHNPCPYGIDTPERPSLIANRFQSYEDMAADIGVSAVYYLPVELFKEVIGEGHCFACFDGDYPVALEDLKKKIH